MFTPFPGDGTGTAWFSGEEGRAEGSQDGVEAGGGAVPGPQDRSRAQGLTDDLGQNPNPVRIATGLDDASEPEAGRQGEGHGLPDDEALKAEADLVGLNVGEGAFLQGQVWMDLLGLFASGLEPVAGGASSVLEGSPPVHG